MPADLPTGTVTFLFTDIEGSTRLVQALGDAWVGQLEAHNRLVGAAIAGNGGRVVKTEGDSYFAVFTAAGDALTATVDAQRALMGHSWPAGGEVRARMGLHTGIGQLGGADYVGLDVHRASRIADAAHGGQTVLSEPTAILVERGLPSDVSLRDLGKHRLKDLAEPEAIFQVVVEGLQTEFPVLRTLDAIPHNLPKQLTSFVGREAELAEALRLVDAARVLTFTGPGGTGKTRLALQVAAEVADRFPDGVFFVDLSTLTDTEGVILRIMETLVLQVSAHEESPLVRLSEHLVGKAFLLVLDNFEQVLGAAPVVTEIVRSSPATKVVVTSRAPLRISGEQELPVPPLGVSGLSDQLDPTTLMEIDAVRLFCDRAMSVRPDFVLTEENAPAVASLVQRLDGLPLAIELVASRLRLLPVDQLLERLDTKMLSSGSVDLPERQRTIEGTIAWSYGLLSEAEQRLFNWFSVFAGGARLEEVEAVCLPEELGGDLIEVLFGLVDHSLVRREDVSAGPRLRMLFVIREFAETRLTMSGDEDTIRRRHAATYAALLEKAAPQLLRHDRKSWLDQLELEHDNIGTALDWAVSAGEVDLARRIVGFGWRFWQARGHLYEARRRTQAVVELEGGNAEDRARALEAWGGILWWLNEMEECRRVYEEALRLERELGDPRRIANALYNYALVSVFVEHADIGHPDSESANEMLAEAAAIYQAAGDPAGEGDVLWGKGSQLAFVDGNFELARQSFEAATEKYRQAGNEFGLGWGLFEIGGLSARLGDLDRAWDASAQALALFAGHGDVSGVVLTLASMSGIAIELGDVTRARRLAGAVRSLQIASGTNIVRNDFNRIEGLEPEILDALTGEEAIPYREGQAMDLDSAVAYGLAGPTDAQRVQ